MTNGDKRRFIEYLSLKEDLVKARDCGIELQLDGTLSTPGDIAGACVFNEDGGYMKDYGASGAYNTCFFNFRPVHRQ